MNWIVTTDDGDSPPLGTIRVIRCVLREDGRTDWTVEGEAYVPLLPGLIDGVVEVREVLREG